jgi:transitional endoplasmic reticulum ATPase
MVMTKQGHYRDLMPLWRLRDYDDDDLDQAIQIWDQSRTPGSAEPVFAVAEVMAAARAGQPAVVAEVGDEVVGMAVARTDGERRIQPGQSTIRQTVVPGCERESADA